MSSVINAPVVAEVPTRPFVPGPAGTHHHHVVVIEKINRTWSDHANGIQKYKPTHQF